MTSRIRVDVGRLAARHRLTAYDAVYLELALRLRLLLATGNKALAVAAAEADLDLLSIS